MLLYFSLLMESTLKVLASGTVISPPGFLAGATESGIKRQGGLDLAILYSQEPCVAAGVFTTNAIKSAPVLLSQKHLQDRNAQAIVVNSGCANASTGAAGLADAEAIASMVAKRLGMSSNDVLVAGTGVIGVPLPMARVRDGIDKIVLTDNGGHELAQAMMTTDTFAKEIAVFVDTEPDEFTVGGVAKGAGMIHPNMATMLCFLTTDASVEADFLQSALQKAVDFSFNMVTVDGDTSPSDTVVILANGLAKNKPINERNGEVFQQALTDVCLYLAKCVVRDGEGANKLIEVTIEGALNDAEARVAARTVASSALVKSAIHGNDPNWGRIVAAVGRSGVKVSESKLDVYLNGVCVMKQGIPIPFDEPNLSASLASKEVYIKVELNLGRGRATAWGCDLSEEYVTINSAYTT